MASEEGELPELPSEASTYKMQRALYDIALNASSGGAVATTFSTISPNVAIYQVRCAAPAALCSPCRTLLFGPGKPSRVAQLGFNTV